MRSRFAARAAHRNRRAQLLARAPRVSPTIEATYVAAVRRALKSFHAEIRRAVEPQVRHDSFASAFRTLGMRARQAADAFRATAFQIAKRLEKYSKAEAVRSLGDLASDLPDTVLGFAEVFAEQAVDKLHGLMAESLDAVELGVSATVIGEEQGAFSLDGILEAWVARGISSARNMVTQGTAELNQERQIEAGVESYVWLATRDAATRPEHAALDGQECSWDEPPLSAAESSSGEPCHAGDDYNCRCLASPVVRMTAEPAAADEGAA